MKKNTFTEFLKYNLLNNLKTPSFYIITLLFTIFVSVNYFIRQQFFAGSGTTDLTLYFTIVPYICILVIPALCYKHSFTVYDAFIPLKNSTKIFVHVLSDLILFTAMLICILPGALLVNLFGSIDGGQLFTSMLCLLFYGAAVISVTVFIDKCLPNRISSFVVSAIVLTIFNSAHLFAVYAQLPQFLTTICKQLSFAWHFDAAGKGILDTRDLLWLLGTATFFVALAAWVDARKNGVRPALGAHASGGVRTFQILIIIAILIMLNGTRWFTRIDFSKNKTYSVSKYTKQLASKVEKPVKITYYRSSAISKLYPQIRDVSDFLNEYAALSKNISLVIKDPDKDEQIRTMLENYGITTQQLRSVKNTSTEYTNVYSAIILEYDGNAETIPFTMAANTLEYDLDGRLKHLISGKTRTVNIVVGNGKSLNEDYGYVIPWLSSQGFLCNPLFIEDPAFADELNKTTGPLFVIGDDKIKIESAIAIENYILCQKGNALFTVSPYSVNIEEDWYMTQNARTNIVEMLESWGAQFLPKIAADISCARITMYSEDSHTEVLNYPLWPSLLQQENAPVGVTVFWPSALELSQNAKPYLYTSPLSYYYEIDRNCKEKLIETNPFALKEMNASDKEKLSQIVGARISGPLSGLYNLSYTDKTDIIVISDQYFVNSLMTGYIGGETGDYRNFEFITNALLKLNNESELADLQSRSTRDTSFYKITDISQFIARKSVLFIILFGIIPLFIIVMGVVIYVKKD